MNKWIFLFAIQTLLVGVAIAAPVPNGMNIPGCSDIVTACNSANISCKTKKGVPFTGYVAGDHVDQGDATNGGTPVSCGLWIDCVGALIRGQNPPGLDLSPTSTLMSKYGNMAAIQAAAKTCGQNKKKMNL